jgi:hypothetical protein
MNSSNLNFVTSNEILADVLKLVQDEGFKMNSKGWYNSQMQQGLSEMAFDTYFDERSETVDIPDNCRVQMPSGAFNIKNLYLVNGDDCSIENSTPVYYKRNFINSASGNGYVANNKGDNSSDPFHKNTLSKSGGQNLFYYAVQNGEIMLSSNCRGFKKLFIQFSGVGTDIGEVPYIPVFMRQAIKDYVSVQALTVKVAMVPSADLNRWSMLLNKAENSLDIQEMREGSWLKARRRIKKLDFKQRNDIKERMQKMYY